MSGNPKGNWGSYPADGARNPAGNLYGWARVSGTDGSFLSGGKNLTCTKLGTGSFELKPANTKIPSDKSFASAINADDAPFVLSVLPNIGPDSNWFVVNSYLSSTGVATDSDFFFYYYTDGDTLY